MANALGGADLNISIPSYSVAPRSAAQYSMMRGVTDFSNAEQFNMYEGGFGILLIINGPKFMDVLAERGGADSYDDKLVKGFNRILEYEFKGIDGLEDITTETLDYTDGISTLQMMGRSTQQGSTEFTMRFTEKSGSLITKYLERYIKGVRDPRSQAKTYHGLIAAGYLYPGFENEVFNFLYIATDNTLLGLEKAYLIANAWPTKATDSIYNMEKGNIEIKEVDVTFNGFPIEGKEVDKVALEMLAYINEDGATNGRYLSENGKAGYAEALAVTGGVQSIDKKYRQQLSSTYYDYKGVRAADYLGGVRRGYSDGSIPQRNSTDADNA